MLLSHKGFFFILFFLFFFINSLEGVSIRLEESSIKLNIPAGTTYTGTIKVYNQENQPVKVKVYLEDWAYTDEHDGSKNFFPKGSTDFSCAPWITFSPEELILPVYGVSKVNYTLKLPPDAQGGYYAVMFFESETLLTRENVTADMVTSTVNLKVRLGCLFFVEAKDTVKRLAELSDLSIEKNKYFLISLNLKNIGNTYIVAGGTYHIMDKKGIIYARGEFNDVYTFPKDSAKLTAVCKESLPKGEYSLVLTLNLAKDQIERGFVRAPVVVKEAEIEIGEEGEVLRVGELK